MYKTGHNDQCDATVNLPLEMMAFDMGGPLLMGGVKAHIDRYLQHAWLQLIFLDKLGLAPHADITKVKQKLHDAGFERKYYKEMI
jgi:hypothetical protein